MAFDPKKYLEENKNNNQKPETSEEDSTDVLDEKPEEATKLDRAIGTAYGAGQGLTAGFLDELLAGAGAGGEKVLEAIGATEQTPSSLADLYEQYKKSIREKGAEYTKKAGLPATAAEFAGAVVGPGKILKGASSLGLLGRLGVAGATGGLEAYGKSEAQTGKEALSDVTSGIGTGFIGGGLGEVASAGAKKATKEFMDSQIGRQLLAVAKQAGEGGSIYGEKAGIESTRKALQETAADLEEKLTKRISQSNKMVADEAQKATQAGKVLNPETIKDALDETTNAIDVKALRRKVPLFSALEKSTKPETDSMKEYTLKMLGQTPQKETLNPSDTLKLMDQLRDYAYSLTDANEKSAVMGLRESLEKQFNEMLGGESTMKMLKAAGHQARAMPEPFLQQKGRIIMPTTSQEVLATQASSMPFREMQQGVRSNIESILRQAGKPSSIGQEVRADISNLPQYIKDINKIAGGALPTIEDEITRELSQKSALIGAKQSAFGQLGAASGVEIEPGIINKLGRKVLSSPFKVAEYLGKKPEVHNYARYMLEESDEKLFGLANKLKSDPNFAHYGDAIEKALATGRRDMLNPVIFAMMQNPATREIAKAFIPGTEE